MTYYLAITLAAFLGGVISGFAGFAFSAAAGAILLHFMHPLQAIPLMMLCSIASQATSLAALRHAIVWSEVTPLLLGGLAGVPLALALLITIDATLVRYAFGAILVAYSGYMLLRPAMGRFHATGGALAGSAVGFAGGLVGGFTAMPGALPTIWCDLRGIGKERQRGLVQPFILGMQVFAILIILSTTTISRSDLAQEMLIAAPALLVGTFLGLALFGRVDEKRFRAAVLVLLLFSGALMMR